jgi:hypothetical protein
MAVTLSFRREFGLCLRKVFGMGLAIVWARVGESEAERLSKGVLL